MAWYGGHCPICGRFCKNVYAWLNEMVGIKMVVGECKIHGEVDLTNQEWDYGDFDFEEKEK